MKQEEKKNSQVVDNQSKNEKKPDQSKENHKLSDVKKPFSIEKRPNGLNEITGETV